MTKQSEWEQIFPLNTFKGETYNQLVICIQNLLAKERAKAKREGVKQGRQEMWQFLYQKLWEAEGNVNDMGYALDKWLEEQERNQVQMSKSQASLSQAPTQEEGGK
jgi:hypothetical protein